MTRRRIIALSALGVSVVLLLLLAASLRWLLFTQAGLDWATGMAHRALPETVEFGRAEGQLAGPLTLHGIVVDHPAARVEVGRVSLDWRPLALVRSRLRVSELSVSTVDIALPPTAGRRDAESTGPPAMPGLPSDVSLPLDIVVERLAVEGVTLRLANGRVEHVERLGARAELGPDGVALREVELRAPLADIDGRVHVGGTRPFTVRGGLDWRIRPPLPEIPAMAGRLDLDGTLEDLRLALRWHAPAAASVTSRARLFGGRPRWSATVDFPVTALRQWWQAAPEFTLGTELELEGTFERVNASGRVELQGLPLGPLRARLTASATPEALQVERLQLDLERYPDMGLDGHGRLDLAAATPEFRAGVEWHGLRWPLDGPAQVTSPSGRMTADGTLAEYALEGEADLRTPRTGDEPIQVELRAGGSTEALSALDLRAAWHEARLRADGQVQWQPTGNARLDFALSELDPARIAPELAGRLALRGRLQSTWSDAVTAELALDSLEGELHGQPVSGSARVRYGTAGTRIETLKLAAGSARAQASGVFAQTLGFDWSVAIPRVDALVSGWRGRVEASGRVSGPIEAPRVTVRATAAEVALPMVELASLEVDGTVAPLGGSQSSLAVRAAGIVADVGTIRSLELQASGTPERHRLELRLQSDRGDAEFAVAGAGTPTEWSGRLLQAMLAPDRLGRWVLVDPAAIDWHGGRLEAGPACWRQDAARLCLSAAGAPGDWRGELDARSIQVGLLARLARKDLDYSGAFDLQAQLHAGAAGATGQVILELTPGVVSGVIEGEPETLLDYGAGRAVARLGSETIELEAALPLADDGVIRFEGRLGRAERRVLEGRLQTRIGDLRLVSVLAPQVGRVEGRLLADIEFGGTLAQPTAAGDVRLDGGRVELVTLGIDLTDIGAELSTADEAFDIRLSARSGDGVVEAQARVRRELDQTWRGSGKLVGEAFRVMDIPAAEIVLSPAIDWQFEGRAVNLSGKVMMPHARIEPRDLSGTVQTTPDAVIVGARQPIDPQPPLEVSADIEVVLGPDVHIDAFGLEGRLEGAIRVREQPGKLTAATGELRVAEGTYTFYRQSLEIERGRVIYGGGPATNPGLDVRAVRRPRNVVVGANVRGTLREPRIELFSEPPMEESQQLSYLILGVPLREAESGQQSAVAAAAAALARSKRGGELASSVGIQQVDVERGTDGEGTSIVLGRYLSPRLYVGYGVGLMEQANSVRMRYDLTQNWTVEARSGLNSSADLLYSIEVDRNIEALPGIPFTEDSRQPSDPQPPANGSGQ